MSRGAKQAGKTHKTTRSGSSARCFSAVWRWVANTGTSIKFFAQLKVRKNTSTAVEGVMVEADEDRLSPAVADTGTETEAILSAVAGAGWARLGVSWGWGAFVRRNIPVQQPDWRGFSVAGGSGVFRL